MKVGDRIYLVRNTWKELEVESAVIEKVTPKKIKLATFIQWSKHYFKDDLRISRSFEEARSNFIKQQEAKIEAREEQIAEAKVNIAKAKALVNL